MRQSVIRREVAKAMVSAGLHQSAWSYDLFGRDPQSRIHASFAVGLPDSQRNSESRRADTAGWEMGGELKVRCAFRLRADAQVADTDTALDLIEDATESVEGADRSEGFHVWFLRKRLRTDGDGTTLLAELDFALRYMHYLE